MARDLEKTYKNEDERIATFRITHGKLTAFQAVCKDKGLSMSESLIGFIDSVLGGSDIPRPVTEEARELAALREEFTQAITDIESKSESKFGALESKFGALEEELAELKKLEMSA